MKARWPLWRVTCAVIGIALLGGCAASGPQRAEGPNPDPLEPMNRAIYRFNDVVDRYVGKPVARAYGKTPVPVRTGIGNFLDNLRYPITIVNDFLQGKVRQGGADLLRFTVNSTIGLLGVLDPAAKAGLRENDEDFGQTFAVWGLGDGPYLVIPIFGPYTAGSVIGDLAGTQISLLTQGPKGKTAIALWALYLVDKRHGVLDFDEQIQQAFDPYLFIRDAYLQNRRYKIYDGNVPDDELYPEDDFADEADAEPAP